MASGVAGPLLPTWDLNGAVDDLPGPVEPDPEQRPSQQPVRVG